MKNILMTIINLINDCITLNFLMIYNLITLNYFKFFFMKICWKTKVGKVSSSVHQYIYTLDLIIIV